MMLKFLIDITPGESSNGIPVAPVVTDPFLGIFKGVDGLFSLGGILAFLGALWSFYTILAYVFSILLLVLYVYASVQKNLYADLQTQTLRDAEKLWEEQHSGTFHSTRMQDVLNHMESDNPNDWKLAIIEADIILEDALKQKGYPGATLGERLKSLTVQQLNSLQDAWEAHTVRNRIAHSGSDFVLTKRIAQETIGRYQRVFMELGVL